MIKYVYRIESSEGEGCYTGTGTGDGRNVTWSDRDHSDMVRFPNPMKEMLVDNIQDLKRDGWLCGFKDLNQLQSWVTPCELKRLYKLGYKIKRKRVRDIRIGRRQVIFKPYKPPYNLTINKRLMNINISY